MNKSTSNVAFIQIFRYRIGPKEMRLQILKVSEIIATLTLSMAVLIASNTYGTGSYEVNIYSAYSPLFWSCIIATGLISILTAFGWIFEDTRNYNWSYPLVLLALTNVLILLIPYLRDYAFVDQSDSVNNYSMSLEILQNTMPSTEDFYPVSHMLAAGFSQLTNLSLQTVVLIFPAIFYCIYLTNIAFAIWIIDDRPSVRGLAMILATPLVFQVFNSSFRTTQFAVYTLPLVIGWLYFAKWERPNWVNSIPFLLVLGILPFLHPWAVISAICVLITLGTAFILRRKFSGAIELYIGTPLLIVLITWLTWFMAFRIFGKTLDRLLLSFIGELNSSRTLEDYLVLAQRAKLPLSKLLSLIFYTYGPALFYLLPVGVVLIWMLRKIVHQRSEIPIHVGALCTFVFIFIGLSVISLFKDLVTQNPLRLLNFSLACVPLLTSSVYYTLVSNKAKVNRIGRNSALKMGLASVLVCVFVLGIFTIYPSPLNGKSNRQFSYAQQAGIQFLMHNKADNDKLLYAPFARSSLLASLLSADKLSSMLRESPSWRIQLAPAHFGYEPLHKDFDYVSPGYLWVAAPERALYTHIWTQDGRYTPKDFDQLLTDPNWQMIYTSGDIDIWQKNHAY